MLSIDRQVKIREAILAGHPLGGGLRERWHRGGRSGSLRAAIFGMSDGLVSNLALILGVAGAGVGSSVVVVAGVAGLLAGAFSMGVGEYLSMRIQREIFEHAIEVEALEQELKPEAEIEELTALYVKRGIPLDAARQVATTLMEDPKRALDVHAREELGLDPDELGSPWGAALSSFVTFSVGAFVPLLPYLIGSGGAAFAGAIAAGALALGLVGGTMAALTSRPPVVGATRMLLLGTITATVTFGIGSLFDVAVA
jgi:VIT1/CCC1 family predicted Fe2+/Mn2+ transporter